MHFIHVYKNNSNFRVYAHYVLFEKVENIIKIIYLFIYN